MDDTLEQKAVALWRRWFDEHGMPWECNDYGQTYCFFCLDEHPEHDPDCIYVAAAKVLGRDLTTQMGP